ncbi:hypothetical protein ACFXPY_46670 [Streptomyces sp. NPDC059153]|uniref:hypothetical protein n=1 Tax=Streptomyces sp. NPDC059153 TaxID=3346743 RepID=UPI0036A8B753
MGERVAYDGAHELYGRIDPIKAGTLEYAVRTGTNWAVWTPPVALGFESLTPPALASYNGVLHAVYTRPSDMAVMWTRLESPVGGGSPARSTPARIGNDATLYAPALTAGHGKLFYAVTGLDNGLYRRTYAGVAWSDAGRISPPARRTARPWPPTRTGYG